MLFGGRQHEVGDLDEARRLLERNRLEFYGAIKKNAEKGRIDRVRQELNTSTYPDAGGGDPAMVIGDDLRAIDSVLTTLRDDKDLIKHLRSGLYTTIASEAERELTDLREIVKARLQALPFIPQLNSLEHARRIAQGFRPQLNGPRSRNDAYITLRQYVTDNNTGLLERLASVISNESVRNDQQINLRAQDLARATAEDFDNLNIAILVEPADAELQQAVAWFTPFLDFVRARAHVPNPQITEFERSVLLDHIQRFEQLYHQAPASLREFMPIYTTLRRDARRIAGLSENEPIRAEAVAAQGNLDWYSITIQDISRLSYEQLVWLINSRSINPYEGDTTRITDEKDREVVIQFQSYTRNHPNERLTPQEEAERARLKLDLFCRRYSLNHAGDNKMPIADPKDLVTMMATTNADLARADILAFTRDHPDAEKIKVMIEFTKFITSRRPEKELKRRGWRGRLLEKFSQPTRESGRNRNFLGITITAAENAEQYTYPEITKGDIDHTEKLRAYLHKKLVEEDSPHKLSEEVFSTIWRVYYTFGGFDVSLALQQKWSQTRSDLTHLTSDPNDVSRPFHIYAHQGSRYGGWKNANGWYFAATSKYPDFWVAAHKETSSGKELRSLQEVQEEVKLYLESYFPLDGIENTIYPDPRDPHQRENFIRFWNPEAYERKYLEEHAVTEAEKEEVRNRRRDGTTFDFNRAMATAVETFVAESAPVEVKFYLQRLREELKRNPQNNQIKAEIQRVTNEQYRDNFDELWVNMWDLSVFPDDIECFMEGLSADGSIVSLGNLEIAKKGWIQICNLIRGEINGGKPITKEELTKQGGIFDSIIGKGIGLAKLVEGRHKRFFVPYLRMFLGRVASQYAPEPGDTDTDARLEMASEIVMKLTAAIEDGGGEGLKGLPGFKELRDELEPHGKIYNQFVQKDKAVPTLLRNHEREKTRFKAYKEYVIAEHKARTGKEAPILRSPIGVEFTKGFPFLHLFPQRPSLRRFWPFGAGTLSQRRRFRTNMREQTYPEAPLSRVADTNTAQKASSEKH